MRGCATVTDCRNAWHRLARAKKHVLSLGGGFGGLELATRLSETMGDAVRVTLLDRNDSWYFGYSKLDVMLGRRSADEGRLCCDRRRRGPHPAPAGPATLPQVVHLETLNLDDEGARSRCNGGSPCGRHRH